MTIIYTAKKSSGVKGEDGKRLAGIPRVRPAEFRRLNKRQRTVNRAYGGSKSHTEVRNRIVRAFLVEEAKLVKRIMQQREKDGDSKTEKKKSKKSKKSKK